MYHSVRMDETQLCIEICRAQLRKAQIKRPEVTILRHQEANFPLETPLRSLYQLEDITS